MRIFEQILLQTRQKFAGILGVWQEFLTQYAAKFAEKTQADAYAPSSKETLQAAGQAICLCIYGNTLFPTQFKGVYHYELSES